MKIIKKKMIKRTRKDYNCYNCKRVIPKGSPCKAFTRVNGKMDTVRQCLQCKEDPFLIVLGIILIGLLIYAVIL